jgi:hypothetical protein
MVWHPTGLSWRSPLPGRFEDFLHTPETTGHVGSAMKISCHAKRYTYRNPNVRVSDTNDETAVETGEEIGAGGFSPAVVASIGSVALALYYYYVRGDKQRGQFVGLWPVTILALALYFKLDEIKRILAERGE